MIALVASLVLGDGAALLREAEVAARRLQGFSCDLAVTRIYPSAKSDAAPMRREQKLKVQFARPNLFKIETDENGNQYRSLSDGNNLFWVSKDRYTKGAIDAKAKNYHWYHDDLLHFLVDGSFAEAVEAPRPPVVQELAGETWNGKPYRILEARVTGGYPIRYRLYVGSDHLIHRIVHEEENYGRTLTIDSSAETIVPNPSRDRSTFAYTAPVGSKEESQEFALRPGEFPPIQPGGTATDFSLPTPAGGKLSLAETLKGRKAVLLNFWFVHCPPCRAEHPHLQRLYDELSTKGLGLIAIDDQDAAAPSAAYLKGAGLTFPVVLTGPRFKTDPTTGQIDYQGPSLPDYASLFPYGVRECPTNVLIDAKTGKVVYRSTEWDEAGLRRALKSLGVG